MAFADSLVRWYRVRPWAFTRTAPREVCPTLTLAPAAALVAAEEAVVVAVVLVFDPLEPHAARITTNAGTRIRRRRISLLSPTRGDGCLPSTDRAGRGRG